jgi:hypothetical protein
MAGNARRSARIRREFKLADMLDNGWRMVPQNPENAAQGSDEAGIVIQPLGASRSYLTRI